MSHKSIRTFGLIGKTLSHSFSALYFTKKFESEKISASYENFELDNASIIPSILHSGISGCNITIPYKEEVISFLDDLSDEASVIGSVNCIVIRNGKAIGHNTDAYGFKESLRPVLRNTHQKALILGTGGASKAVAYVLKELGLEFRFVSRNPTGSQLGYGDLNDKALAYFPFIINTTPLGTAPNVNQAPDIPYPYINESNLLYDLTYNPAESLFLKKGKAQGALTMNGHKMLLYQAEQSWELWNADYLK
jgi:shikimate dehydrogenase